MLGLEYTRPNKDIKLGLGYTRPNKDIKLGLGYTRPNKDMPTLVKRIYISLYNFRGIIQQQRGLQVTQWDLALFLADLWVSKILLYTSEWLGLLATEKSLDRTLENSVSLRIEEARPLTLVPALELPEAPLELASVAKQNNIRDNIKRCHGFSSCF